MFTSFADKITEGLDKGTALQAELSTESKSGIGERAKSHPFCHTAFQMKRATLRVRLRHISTMWLFVPLFWLDHVQRFVIMNL